MHLEQLRFESSNVFLLVPKVLLQALIMRLHLVEHGLQLLERLGRLAQQILSLLRVRINLNYFVLVTVKLSLQLQLLTLNAIELFVDCNLPIAKLLPLRFKSVNLLACVCCLGLNLVVLQAEFLEVFVVLFVLDYLLAHLLAQLGYLVLQVPFFLIQLNVVLPHSGVVCARLALQVVQVSEFVLHVLNFSVQLRRLVLSLRLLVEIVVVLSVLPQL